MINYIIYDLDGTIIDSVDVFMSAYQDALKLGAGMDLTFKSISKILGPNEVGVFQKIVPENAKECLDIFYEIEKSKVSEITLFGGIRDFIKKCHQHKIKQFIVTGRAEYHAEYFLKHFGIYHYFEEILTGDDSFDIKGTNIQIIFDKHTCRNSKNVIYLGDTINDLKAAKYANVPYGLCRWKSNPVTNDSIANNWKTAHIFDSVSDLDKWIFGDIINE